MILTMLYLYPLPKWSKGIGDSISQWKKGSSCSKMGLAGKGEFQWIIISCSFLKIKKSVQHGTKNGKNGDIYKTITLWGMDNRDEELLIQREQARLGIPLVVIDWLGQTIFSFIDVVSCRWFVGYLLIFLIIVGILIAVVTWNNKKFREKYKENKNSRS